MTPYTRYRMRMWMEDHGATVLIVVCMGIVAAATVIEMLKARCP